MLLVFEFGEEEYVESANQSRGDEGPTGQEYTARISTAVPIMY